MEKEIKVKVSKDNIKFTKDGVEKTVECIAIHFPVGEPIKIFNGRYTYKAYDYLKELIEK